ncbi:uncharacterized protein METZ01_LOCUS300778 [marine metagenome]|uniref:Response regulatory domain-containing protein n=1 Tax=marine metagenome TaxID=408172 RepID=A0A382MG43_9ZZZZ
MLNRRLELKNFNVLCAHDGQEAIDIAISEIPDLILMDLSIPIKDGLTATKEIKKNKVTMDIPVIALTAHAMDTDKNDALEAGCDEFATKPVKFQALLNKMELLLDKDN